MYKNKLLRLFFIFFIYSAALCSQNTYEYTGDEYEEEGIMNFSFGYNTFYPNYPKTYFYFEDTIQQVYILDSIQFKGSNNTFRIGLNPQLNIHNNLFLNIECSLSLPIQKHPQLNHYSIGLGYQLKANDYITIKPMLLLELNKHYYNFKTFTPNPGQQLIVNGKSFSGPTEIRYFQASRGFAPKISVSYKPKIKTSNNNSIVFSFDCGYHIPFSRIERIQFKHSTGSTGDFFTDIFVNMFRNLNSKKVLANEMMYYNGTNTNQKIITPEKMYFTFKIGYTF